MNKILVIKKIMVDLVYLDKYISDIKFFLVTKDFTKSQQTFEFRDFAKSPNMLLNL